MKPIPDAVLLRALAKKPEDRFASITAFAQALQQAVQNFDLSTVVKTPQSNNLYATLAISEVEARMGTSRTLTLPGGRQVSIYVPVGAYDGQIIRLEGQGEPASQGKLAGALILTLNVKNIAGDIPAPRPRFLEETIPPTGSGSSDRTLPASNPKLRADAPCSNPRIHTGLNQPNVVAVVANNNSIALYVNHQFITSASDNTYSQGQIGVVADNDNSPTTVVFRSAKVWTF